MRILIEKNEKKDEILNILEHFWENLKFEIEEGLEMMYVETRMYPYPYRDDLNL
jgi:hypothetical protein